MKDRKFGSRFGVLFALALIGMILAACTVPIAPVATDGSAGVDPVLAAGAVWVLFIGSQFSKNASTAAT